MSVTSEATCGGEEGWTAAASAISIVFHTQRIESNSKPWYPQQTIMGEPRHHSVTSKPPWMSNNTIQLPWIPWTISSFREFLFWCKLTKLRHPSFLPWVPWRWLNKLRFRNDQNPAEPGEEQDNYSSFGKWLNPSQSQDIRGNCKVRAPDRIWCLFANPGCCMFLLLLLPLL